MNTNDFDYELDESLIAQTPLLKRDESKLMIVDKNTGEIKHEKFLNIINYLNEEDILVFNNTKVLPARLIGEKTSTKAIIEVLMLKDIGNNIWECLTKPAKRVKIGDLISFGNGKLVFECIKKFDEGITHYKLIYEGILLNILDELGTMPLPPYIKEKLNDKDRYQTIYAKHSGSAAAPTAGLHFTDELLNKIKEKNIKILFVTLHVGLGTFRPVNVENVLEHKMHSEEFFIDEDTANELNDAVKNKKRIISVGTTTTRVLESVYTKYNKFISCNESTDIFIYPGYKFKVVNSLITNFHLPKSTLLMLVSALSSKEIIFKAYKEAIKNNYRFFSFGDSMFIKEELDI